MSKTFSQKSSEAFLNLENSALCRTKKKTAPACFNRVFWKALRKKQCFIWLLKNEKFWQSPTSFEWAYGFHNKTPGKTVRI